MLSRFLVSPQRGVGLCYMAPCLSICLSQDCLSVRLSQVGVILSEQLNASSRKLQGTIYDDLE